LPSVQEDLKDLEARVVARIRELRPLVEEYHELLEVAERLGVTADTSPARAKRAAKPQRRQSPRRTRAGSSGRQRPGGRSVPGGTQGIGAGRRERALTLIAERPGITASEIAKEIGVDPPQIHRVMRKLLSERVVQKDGSKITLV
jgi:Fic family protein